MKWFFLIVIGITFHSSHANANFWSQFSQGSSSGSAISNRASALAGSEFARIQQSREVYSWEVASPRDRTPHYCSQECACLAKYFSQVFRRNGIPFRTLQTGAIDVDTNSGRKFFNYHLAILIPDGNSWMIIDPVVLGTTRAQSMRIWMSRVRNINSVSGRLF